MSRKLELVREEKLYRLLPGKKESRLEASGVALVDDKTALVVFDNLNPVARIDLSLKPRRTNRLLPAPSLGTGFEDIAFDREGGRVLCLIEALEDVDGFFRGFVAEYDAAGQLRRLHPSEHEVRESRTRGSRGWPTCGAGAGNTCSRLCEGNLGTDAKEGGGRIDAFTRAKNGGWEALAPDPLPRTAEFEDYAALAYRDGRMPSSRRRPRASWTARIDARARALVPGSEAVHRFPSKSYGNVEGIAWLTEDTLVAVSDKKKARQPERCAEKDQSIHLFRIPAA